MRIVRASAVILFVSALSACGATLVPLSRAEVEPLPELTGFAEWGVVETVEHVAHEFIAESGAPGVQVAVRFGQRRFAGAYGHRDGRRREFANVDDVYRVGSVTKVATAAVILSLVEEGRLSLDSEIGGWVDLPNADGVTVRHLLNHTSGLANYTERLGASLGTFLRPRRSWRPEQLISRVRRRPLHFEPGTEYRYSNTNYVALGLIAESVSGRPLAELYRERVFARAGMTGSWFPPYENAPDPGLADRLVTGFERDLLPLGTQRMTPVKTGWPTYAFSAGAMAAPAIDLVRMMDALFDGIIVSAQSLRAMTAAVDAPEANLPEQTGYGLGLRRLRIDGTEFFGHTGTIPGFGAAVLHAPGAEYTVAVVGNLSDLDAIELVRRLLAALRDVPEWRLR